MSYPSPNSQLRNATDHAVLVATILLGRAPFVLLARIVLLHVISLRLQLYLAQRRCASLDEMCDNEMSRDHDAPVEYYEISLR